MRRNERCNKGLPEVPTWSIFFSSRDVDRRESTLQSCTCILKYIRPLLRCLLPHQCSMQILRKGFNIFFISFIDFFTYCLTLFYFISSNGSHSFVCLKKNNKNMCMGSVWMKFQFCKLTRQGNRDETIHCANCLIWEILENQPAKYNPSLKLVCLCTISWTVFNFSGIQVNVSANCTDMSITTKNRHQYLFVTVWKGFDLTESVCVFSFFLLFFSLSPSFLHLLVPDPPSAFPLLFLPFCKITLK